jgi:hypothetical protein
LRVQSIGQTPSSTDSSGRGMGDFKIERNIHIVLFVRL